MGIKVEKGPTVAEKLSEVVSTEKRLKAPTKAVRKGRRPPTRGKKAGAAVKSVRTETNDPPKDMSKEEPTPKSMAGAQPMNMLGGPTRAISPNAVAGLRKTVAPVSSKSKNDSSAQTDFRTNLRSTVAPGSVKITKEQAVAAEAPENPVKSNPFGPRVTSTKMRNSAPDTPTPTEPAKKTNPFGPRVTAPRTNSPRKTAPKEAPSRPQPSPVEAAPSRPAPSTPQGESPNLPPALGDYKSFCTFVESSFEKLKKERINGTASISPQLNRADSSHFSFAMCTVDGVKYTYGEQHSFSLQEAAFPFLFAIASSVMGAAVDNMVSDVPYTAQNPMTLQNQKAQNPLCPAGGITLCSALYETQDIIDRSAEINQKLSDFAGTGVGTDIANFFAAKKYNYADKSLAYWLQSNMPLVGNIDDTIDLYFQTRAAYTSCEQLACMAATLANKGKNPTSNRKVISPAEASKTVDVLQKCKIGNTLKAAGAGGESGSLFVVIPGVAGFAVYSPLLNNKGLSARGIRICNDICTQFNLL